MTNRELLLRALNNQEVERPPVSFWFHFVTEAEKTKGLERPELAEQSLRGHKRYFEGFHPDFVKIMSDGFFGYPQKGQTVKLDLGAETAGDLVKFQPVSAEHPWIQAQIAQVKKITALQKDTMYFYNIFNPATTLRRLTGLEALIGFFRADPQALADTLLRMAEGIAVQAQSVIKQGGADGIYLSAQNPDINRISDEEYRRYFSPADKIVLDAANGASETNILHICGSRGCRNHLAAWTGYKAKAYNWAVNVEGLSLAEGKKLFGGAAVIGGFANTAEDPIYRGPRKEIEDCTEKIIAETGKRGLILGADCTVPDDTPFEHFEWVREKAKTL
ncbi:MAG: uroporphyrinogen decarboxylase [Spirochaetaceae bacterium]|jgi:uroporphyrinogen decarboxylase|nr:uroporphyrinogen decarboxylase [Spirochaetaceae bacterium]